MVRRCLIWGLCAIAAGVVALLAVAASRSALVAPEPTLLVRDRSGAFLGELAEGEELGFWRLDGLPPRVVAATLAIEDRRFFRHPGVDPLAIGRAMVQLARNKRRISGASTLAMQVARMQARGPRTYGRKLVEALTAMLLTLRNGREAVLAHYLRLVPYGNRVHGIAYAARRYLDKPVEDLSWAEVAFLSALPQAPARMNPYSPAGRLRAIERGRRILAALRDQGSISPAEHAVALEQIGRVRIPARERRPQSSMHALLHLGAVLREPAARSALPSPLLQTTLDLALQEDVSWKTFEAVRSWEGRGAGNAAVIVLESGSLAVRAWVGSADYFDRLHAGAIDYASAARSPGSTLKPLLFALALERGELEPAGILDDLQRSRGGIANADSLFLGPLLPRVALASSRNVPAVHLLSRVGVDVAYGFLGELGLHEALRGARHYGLELAIGGMPTSLRQLVRAYGVLARDGRLGELRWLEDAPAAPERRVLGQAPARQVTLWLSDPMARLPTFSRMGPTEYPFPVAVKTGTSSGYRDAWTIAYSKRHIVGVWVGHPDARPMNGLSGSSSAARLAREVLMTLHARDRDGQSDGSFPPPEGFRSARVCGRTGKRATPACDQVLTEWFPPSGEPASVCDAHVRLAVDERDGRPATPQTPAEHVLVQTFTLLAPRYAAWAATQGLPRPPAALQTPRPAHPSWPGLPFEAAGQQARRQPKLRITAPEDGARLLRDPEAPAGRSTLPLQVVADPPVDQVVWYVDGKPFQVADHPYGARWPLERGVHTFEARMPFSDVRSPPVSVTVQ
jgi:penicillin-binding protein 1C